MIPPAALAVVAVALYAAHYAGDYWVQQHTWAGRKARPGRAGHAACLAHVVTYTVTCLGATLAAAALTGVRLAPWAVAAGAVVNAVTHYAADRRVPLVWLARITGHGEYLAYGTHTGDGPPPAVTGAAMLDQAWHKVCLAVVAGVTATGAVLS